MYFLLIRNKTLDYDCQQTCHKTKKKPSGFPEGFK
jgi:hypothetical protein